MGWGGVVTRPLTPPHPTSPLPTSATVGRRQGRGGGVGCRVFVGDTGAALNTCPGAGRPAGWEQLLYCAGRPIPGGGGAQWTDEAGLRDLAARTHSHHGNLHTVWCWQLLVECCMLAQIRRLNFSTIRYARGILTTSA